MIDNMMPEIRLLDANDNPGEILADVGSIDYMDDSADVGTCTFKYPRNGLRSDLVKNGARACLLLDGEEIPNGKFRMEEWTENYATDTPEFRTWVGRTDIAKLEGRRVSPFGFDVPVFENDGRGWVFTTFAQDDSGLTPPLEQENIPDDLRYPGQVLLHFMNRVNYSTALDKIPINFTRHRDSKNRAWAGPWGGIIPWGHTPLEFVRQMSREGIAEARMIHGTLNLFDLSPETTRTIRAEFAVGRNMIDGPRTDSVTNLVTALLVKATREPEDAPDGYATPFGWFWIPEMVQKWGVIQGYLETEVYTEPFMKRDAENHLRSLAQEKSQVTFGFQPSASDGTIPYQDFGLGDWVLVDIDGTPEEAKVKVITLSWDENRKMTAGLTCNDRFYEIDMARFSRGKVT